MILQDMPEPVFRGRGGRGWRLNISSGLSGDAGHTGLGTYLLEIPHAHPAWDCYLLSVIHLRDVPTLPAAVKYFESATHELQLWACDSRHDQAHDGKVLPEVPFLLRPPNLVEQVELRSDEQAVKLCELLAIAFTEGILSPDTDFRKWQKRAIELAAKRLREGVNGTPE